jgi:hypothetical protein
MADGAGTSGTAIDSAERLSNAATTAMSSHDRFGRPLLSSLYKMQADFSVDIVAPQEIGATTDCRPNKRSVLVQNAIPHSI